eukprot:608591-Karenia_brevis.AAC.1
MDLVDRLWRAVFDWFKGFTGWANFQPVEHHDLPDKNWVSVAVLSMNNIPWRLVNATKTSPTALDCFAEFFVESRPKSNGFVYLNFRNACAKVDPTQPKGKYLVQAPKSPSNNCYILVDCRLDTKITFKPPDADRKRFRNGLTTAFAGNPEGRLIATANDLLGLLELQTIPVVVFHRGVGGNSKSIISDLRHNTYGGTHKFVSPTVFENEEEQRKQSIHFAYARGITVQESSNNPIRPDILKALVGGQCLPARPNYGKETVMLDWMYTAFNWECNEAPKVKVKDPNNLKSLRSLVRRCR